MAAALFSFRAVALAALLLAVIAACGARAQLQPTNASADSQERSLLSYSGGWIPAKATWYGAPTGAGPDDNGKMPLPFVLAHRSAALALCKSQCGSLSCHCHALVLKSESFARRRVRLQAHQPVPLLLHDVVRQRAHLQGRQGLRLLLPGTAY